MPIHVRKEGGFTVEGPEAMAFYRMAALRSALSFEIKTGMKMVRGPSAYSIIEREYGLKGNKQRVFEQFDAICNEASRFIERIPEE